MRSDRSEWGGGTRQLPAPANQLRHTDGGCSNHPIGPLTRRVVGGTFRTGTRISNWVETRPFLMARMGVHLGKGYSMDTQTKQQLTFEPPGPGSWDLDPLHFPRPVTDYLVKMHPEPFILGYGDMTAFYGAPIK